MRLLKLGMIFLTTTMTGQLINEPDSIKVSKTRSFNVEKKEQLTQSIDSISVKYDQMKHQLDSLMKANK